MTPYQPDTGDNNINAMFKLGTIREGFSVNHRLTDPRFWCLKTNVQDGLKHFVRKAISGGVAGDSSLGEIAPVIETVIVWWSILAEGPCQRLPSVRRESLQAASPGSLVSLKAANDQTLLGLRIWLPAERGDPQNPLS